jgi:hypothetical protein
MTRRSAQQRIAAETAAERRAFVTFVEHKDWAHMGHFLFDQILRTRQIRRSLQRSVDRAKWALLAAGVLLTLLAVQSILQANELAAHQGRLTHETRALATIAHANRAALVREHAARLMSEDAYCRIKRYIELSGRGGSELFRLLHVLPSKLGREVSESLKAVQEIPTAKRCNASPRSRLHARARKRTAAPRAVVSAPTRTITPTRSVRRHPRRSPRSPVPATRLTPALTPPAPVVTAPAPALSCTGVKSRARAQCERELHR